MNNLAAFENRIGYGFRDRGLLVTALTHSSYLNEHDLPRERCNERIEYLGDAVLELITSELLYEKYPMLEEGDLTRLRAALVCEPALAEDAKEMDISRYLLLGKGEDQSGGRYRDSVVSDAVEAVIGAVYLDGGIEPARRLIHTFILNDIETKRLKIDAKSELQVLAQEILGATPSYQITGSAGPDHAPVFMAEVRIAEEVFGTGEGRNKKRAEQEAAYGALLRLKGKRQ